LIASRLATRNAAMAGVVSGARFTSTKSQVEIAAEAKRLRPVSPHMTIYQRQLTWVMSGLHRATGVGLATAFYTSILAYLAVPSLDSAAVISTVAELPAALKLAGKFTLALPFTYHAANGIRHLIWDATYALTLKGVYTTGWIVTGVSIVGAGYLATL
jgi:succinate dehydrogenase (ubiquinone) cytochrome b560 subunit